MKISKLVEIDFFNTLVFSSIWHYNKFIFFVINWENKKNIIEWEFFYGTNDMVVSFSDFYFIRM